MNRSLVIRFGCYKKAAKGMNRRVVIGFGCNYKAAKSMTKRVVIALTAINGASKL